MEQGLYAQVIMIRRKDYDNKVEKEKTNKYNFQGQSARSICWFDLDHQWLEANFRTRLYLFCKLRIELMPSLDYVRASIALYSVR